MPTIPRRYLGTWTLPSGNRADLYLGPGDALACAWDTPPSPEWSDADFEHYRRVTFPAIVRAVATATGKPVIGVSL